MAFQNTSERFNYIYGNTARKVEKSSYQETSPRKESPVRKSRPRTRRSTETVVKTNEAFDWKYTFMIIVAVGVVAVCALFYIREATVMNSMATQIQSLKEEKAKLQSRQVSIQSELDKAVNLDEIREYAEENLDMVYPDHDNVIYYEQDSDDYFRQFESVNQQ